MSQHRAKLQTEARKLYKNTMDIRHMKNKTPSMPIVQSREWAYSIAETPLPAMTGLMLSSNPNWKSLPSSFLMAALTA